MTRNWMARLAWGQGFVLVLALAAAGLGSWRARLQQEEAEARRSGLALLEELKAGGSAPGLAEGIYHADDRVAYLRLRREENRVDVTWYRSLALAEGAGCPPPKLTGINSRYCRELDARLVDVQLTGPAPGDLLQAGLWVSRGPAALREGGLGELGSWLLAAGCGLVLVMILGWRRAESLRQLSRRAREVSEVIPPVHRPLESEDEWEAISRTLEGLAKELKWHKVQLSRLNSVFRRRVSDGTRRWRKAFREKEQRSEQEQKEWGQALSALKPLIRHLAQMSRVLEQRVGESLAPEDQGRLRRLLRESEKALSQLLEIEKEFKLVEGEDPVEQVNLRELIWKMAPSLEQEGIRLSFMSPLPTLWLPSAPMERLWRELIHAAAGTEGIRAAGTVEIGYANLRDRLVFFLKGTRGAGVKKLSESVSSRAQRVLEPFRGRLWLEYHPHQGGVIYFTLAKERLTRPETPEVEGRAEAA